MKTVLLIINKNRGIFSTRKARIASGALKKLFCLKQRSCKFIIFSVTKIRVAKENPTSRVFATFCGQKVVTRTLNLIHTSFPSLQLPKNNPDCYRDAQFNHPFTFLTNLYKPMKIIILQNFTCTIYSARLHKWCTFPAQFVHIFALFFTKSQANILYSNTLTNQKFFFTCTNGATINHISNDYQSYSTCTISTFTCTIYAVTIHNTLIFKKLKYVQMMHPIKTLKILIKNTHAPNLNFSVRNICCFLVNSLCSIFVIQVN
jgi:hypothetical protein